MFNPENRLIFFRVASDKSFVRKNGKLVSVGEIRKKRRAKVKKVAKKSARLIKATPGIVKKELKKSAGRVATKAARKVKKAVKKVKRSKK